MEESGRIMVQSRIHNKIDRLKQIKLKKEIEKEGNRYMKKLYRAYCSALVLGSILATTALSAAELRLGDPAVQAIGFDTEKGTLSSWTVSGTDLAMKTALSGFSATDEMTGQRGNFLPIRIYKKDGRIFYKGICKDLGLELDAVFSSGTGNAVLADCTVTDLKRKDRAVTIVFTAALKPGDWGFGNSWSNSSSGVEKIARGRGASQIDGFSGHKQSQIPLGSLDNEKQNASLAHSLRKTRFFSYAAYVADDGIAYLSVSVPLGLSGITENFPHRADFQFAFLGGKGGTGIRGAMQNYYNAFPECFKSRAPYGGWALWVSEQELQAALKCGMGYDQMEFEYSKPQEIIPAIQKTGLAAMQYSEPWTIWMPIPHEWVKAHKKESSTLPTSVFKDFYVPINTADYRKFLAADLKSEVVSDRYPGLTRGFTAQALNNSAIETEDGEWVFHCYPMKDFPWTPNVERKNWSGGFLLANPSPKLPHPNRYDIQLNQVEHIAKQLETTNRKLDVVYLDSVVYGAGWANYNFRREHWKYTDTPLTFAKVNGKAVPALHNALSNADFLAEFRRYCDKHGYAIFDNSWHPVIATHIGYIDALGAGEHVASNLVNPADLRTFRFLAGRKPISTQDYRLSFVETTVEEMDARLNRALMYGIYSGTSNNWKKPEVTARLLKICPKYARLLNLINQAGWEVLSNATVDQGALVERWGNHPASGLYFTVLNPAADPRRVTLSLRAEDYAKTTFTGAKELVDHAPLEFKTDSAKTQITFSIPAGRTYLIQLSGNKTKQ